MAPQNNEQREALRGLSEDYAADALSFLNDTSTTVRTVDCALCGRRAEQNAKLYNVHDKLFD